MFPKEWPAHEYFGSEPPTAANRALIQSILERHPDSQPLAVERHLDRDGHNVPIEQVNGFLAGL